MLQVFVLYKKSNGFVFSVRDKAIATKLATNVVAFEDLEETMVLRCKGGVINDYALIQC